MDFHDGEEFTNSRGEKYTTITYPALVNDADLHALGMATAVSLLKDDGGTDDVGALVREAKAPMLVGEEYVLRLGESSGKDAVGPPPRANLTARARVARARTCSFAFYVEEGVPSCMFHIGHRGEDPATGANHHVRTCAAEPSSASIADVPRI